MFRLKEESESYNAFGSMRPMRTFTHRFIVFEPDCIEPVREERGGDMFGGIWETGLRP